MKINDLMSSIRQHMQKRYIITAQTDALVTEIAESLLDGKIEPEQFFDEVVPAIQAYAHPMMFEEERPFLILGAAQRYSKESSRAFFHTSTNAMGDGWRYDGLNAFKKIARGKALSYLRSGIYKLMGEMASPIPLGENTVVEGNHDVSWMMTQLTQVSYWIRTSEALTTFNEALEDRQVRSRWRKLHLSLRLQLLNEGLDLTPLRNLTWLTIDADHGDLGQMLLDGRIKLPENVQFLTLHSATNGWHTHDIDNSVVRDQANQPVKLGFGLTERAVAPNPYSSGAKDPEMEQGFFFIADAFEAQKAVDVFELAQNPGKLLLEHLTELAHSRAWWSQASLEHQIRSWGHSRLALPTLITYKGPVELLDPKGCRSLLFVQPHNGIFGAATSSSSALNAQGQKHWSPTPGAELSVGLLKSMIAKRFKTVEAVSTCGLNSKSRQDLNKKISMVDLHHDSLECYRRYYLQER